MAYQAGDVILVPFPYRDRLAETSAPQLSFPPVPSINVGIMSLPPLRPTLHGLRTDGLARRRPANAIDGSDAHYDRRRRTSAISFRTVERRGLEGSKESCFAGFCMTEEIENLRRQTGASRL
jgi:hypothetical protein